MTSADKTSVTRPSGRVDPSSAAGWVITGAALAYAGFHLWFATFGTIADSWRNAIHVGGALALFFALRGQEEGRRIAPWLMAAAVCAAIPVYAVVMEQALYARNDQMIPLDMWVSAAILLFVLWAAGLSGGWVLTGMGLLAAAYALWLGPFLPDGWGFRGLSLYTFTYRMLWGGEGYFGFLASISATYVYLFVLLGVVLLAAGSGNFLVQASLRLGARLPGGPAQAAVLGSAAMGSVSGTSIGNVMATGSVTIPMMIRAGYRRPFAAGVEAAASNIGQIAPPVMGAGAFILAAWTQTPYATVAALSILPAILYFYSVFIGVALDARKQDWTPVEIPARIVWRDGLPFALAMAALIGLLVVGYTPVFACCGAILAAIFASWATPANQIGPRSLARIAVEAARGASVTAIMLAAANIVVGVLTMTGKGITFSAMIFDAAQGNLYLMVLAVLLVSLILGMGLPITASYVIVAVVVGSGFEQFGLPLLAVHLMIYWYSQDSTVTPPVALSAFAAAGIARAAPFPASLVAWRLSKGLYAIPLLFLSGDILFQNGPMAAAVAFVGAIVGLTGIAMALSSRCIGGQVPVWLALPLGLTSAATFLLERDIAVPAIGAAAMLIAVAEYLARRAQRLEAQP
ncbi:TRAP transporter permease [Roseicyclus sp.]|uniref:TRAP transporter permease n=1 Tax=Roseicyclus sp. TaxID=1914329 RepID=UPI003FA18378